MSFLYRESKINHIQGINSVLGFLYERLIIIFIMTQIRDIYDYDYDQLQN
jgi:hypothetical protein